MELVSLPALLQLLLQQTIREIYLVDFEYEPEQDLYSPWQLIVVFQQGDQFLVVEDAYDGDHIDIRVFHCSQLASVLTEATVPTLWKPYKTGSTDALSPLLTKQIGQLLYAREKPEYCLNGKLFQGNPSVYGGLKIICEHHSLMVFNNGVGIFVGLDSLLMPFFEETYDWFEVG